MVVSDAVLIPRPETELLVERALGWLSKNPSRRQAIDVGTGSGCIAVALTKNVPDLQVTAVDISARALRVARLNVMRHNCVQAVTLVQSDLLSGMQLHADLLCANLPYIPTTVALDLPVSRYEPSLALDGGADGLDVIRALLLDAPRCLNPGGLALLEIEANQAEAAKLLARQAFPAASIQVLPDLAGLPRLLEISLE